MHIDSKTAWLSVCQHRRAGVAFPFSMTSGIPGQSRLIPSGVPLSVLLRNGRMGVQRMVRRYAHLAPNHLTDTREENRRHFGDNVPLGIRRNKEGVTD